MAPVCCPFCHCLDVRLATSADSDLAGYRCHDCVRTFYVAAGQTVALPTGWAADLLGRRRKRTSKDS